jgi:hypothetical protein
VLRGKASRKDAIPLPADVGAALSATDITNARANGYTPPLSRPAVQPNTRAIAPPFQRRRALYELVLWKTHR